MGVATVDHKVLCEEGVRFISTPTGGGTAARRALVLRSLIPSTTVPIKAFFMALGGMRTQPPALRPLLFKWMVLVYDLVDHVSHLSVLYHMIFQYLSYDELRPWASQLLCYMTKKKHGGCGHSVGGACG